MTIQELEQQLLSLDQGERLRIAQLLTQSLTPDSPPTPLSSEKITLNLTDAIAHFRRNMSPAELDLNAEDIWHDVRDHTSVPDEPRW